MRLLLDAIRGEPEYRALLDNWTEQLHGRTPRPMLVTGLAEGARDCMLGALVADLRNRETDAAVLCIFPDEKDIVTAQAALEEAGLTCAVYPCRDFVFRNIPVSEESGHQRLHALCSVLENRCDAILTTPDAALQFTIPRNVLRGHLLILRRGDCMKMEELVSSLQESGYARAEQVDGAGQYAVRGGIVDVFPAFGDLPVRVDFFGDEIDQMVWFDPISQRKTEVCETCTIPPAKEVLTIEKTREELKKLILSQKKRCTEEESRQILDSEILAIDGGQELFFLDKYLSFLYPDRESLLDYFREERDGKGRTAAAVYVQNLGAVQERIHASEIPMREMIAGMVEGGSISSRYADYCGWRGDFDAFLSGNAAVLCNAFASDPGMRLSGIYTFHTRHTVSYADSYDTLLEDVRGDIANRSRTVIACENAMSAREVQRALFENGVTARISPEQDPPFSEVAPGIPLLLHGADLPGFELNDSRFVIRTLFPGGRSSYVRALTGPGRRKKKKPSAAEKILSYADLHIGDYVVHTAHGIGQYLGIETIFNPIDRANRDYVKLRYADGAFVHVPCESLGVLSKYIGAKGEDGDVRLSKLNSGEWNRKKARAKASARDMAKELISLYAARSRKKGIAYPPDDEIQRSFEQAFPFEETEAQETAIAEIKADMQKAVPMDRLLCGDVGYGKTEVALRAAMKAVLTGKQVAILAPTTILAMQHYQTILSRFRGFPVRTELLSRFNNPKKQEQILRSLRRGETDIVVGTHRLLSKDVAFRELGLVIIDEEQRFGVAAKEHLKQLVENVDCLTLTATPIPRTLNMAMSGIRDMSILDEAPSDRYPVQSFVLEYDESVLAEAVRRELRRGGQVFWLHNRVETIDRCAAKVSQMVPDATVAIAHGKMTNEEISDIWQKLLDGSVDVLVCTTIIETGIDIPNANTMVVENADKMGLAQLHQLRGRIGRSSRRARAYFTYPPNRILTEISVKRLQALRDFTEFGAGFKIAMRDLEIRGAGNLLGAEQHGNMDSVGYDLYIRLLNEAILEEKGVAVLKKEDAVINASVDAYLPESYVSSGAQRIDLYKKIAAIETAEDGADLLEEMTDRYGKPPEAARSLIWISQLRAIATRCDLKRVELKDDQALLYPERFDASIWNTLSLGEGIRSGQNRESTGNGGTALAKAAALAREGALRKGKEAESEASAQPKITYTGGLTPCLRITIRRGKSLFEGVYSVLSRYETIRKEKAEHPE